MMQGQQILPEADDTRSSCYTSECSSYRPNVILTSVLVCQFRAVSCGAKSEICKVAGEPGTTSLVARTLGTSTFVARLHLRLSSAYHQGPDFSLMPCLSCVAKFIVSRLLELCSIRLSRLACSQIERGAE
jgi:hypothetical protein